MAVQIGLPLLSETFISLGSRKEKRSGVFSPELGIQQADEAGDEEVRKPRVAAVSHRQVFSYSC